MSAYMIPIYGGDFDDFHYAGLGSGSGTNLLACDKVKKLDLIICDRPKAGLLELDEFKSTPKIVVNGYERVGSWKKAQGNPEAEAAYIIRSLALDEEIRDLIFEHATKEGINFDLAVLGGWMRIVREHTLEYFRDKMINVHPARLDVLGITQIRRFIGDDAVYLAIKSGQPFTRSSVIMVDEGVDHGEILVTGPKIEVDKEIANLYPFTGLDEKVRAYAGPHQKRQKEVSDWPAITTALEMIANGRLALSKERNIWGEWRTVFLDEKPLPFEGYLMGGEIR